MTESKKTDKKFDAGRSYSTLSGKALDAEPVDQVSMNIIKKNTLLSLYGSMSPIGENTQEKWDDIRIQARKEVFEKKILNV